MAAIPLKPKAYTLLRDRFELKAGETVYQFMGCTYGLVGEDARSTGADHTAVTRSTDGMGHPFFTVPVAYLKGQ